MTAREFYRQPHEEPKPVVNGVTQAYNDIMTIWELEEINSEKKAREFLKDCIKVLGIGFHPDTDFADYIDKETGVYTFTTDEAQTLNNCLSLCHEIFPLMIYDEAHKSGKLVGAARHEAREQALQFVCRLMNCNIPKISIENPIGVIGSRIFWYVGGENGLPCWKVFPRKLDHGGRKPDQIIHPYHFYEDASKSTCLWLKNLPPFNTLSTIRLASSTGRKDGETRQIAAKTNYHLPLTAPAYAVKHIQESPKLWQINGAKNKQHFLHNREIKNNALCHSIQQQKQP